MSDNETVPCDLCGRHVIADAIVSHTEWSKISPTGDENGYLCPACVVERAVRILSWSAARLTDARKPSEVEAIMDALDCGYDMALEDAAKMLSSEKIAQLIHDYQKKLLADYGVHEDAWRGDPELYDSAQLLAEAIAAAAIRAMKKEPDSE